jgi:hypothetical protein
MKMLQRKQVSSAPPKKTGKNRSLYWRPRTAEEIARQKNRKVISQHLKRIGKAAGRDLSLDDNGSCCFTFRKFVVCASVPEDTSSVCVFYSKICHLGPFDNREEVEKYVNVYNHRQSSHSFQQLSDVSSASDNSCYCWDPNHAGTHLQIKDDEEVNLCLSFPIQGLSFEDTATKLEFFVKTAVATNRKLEKAKSTPLKIIREPTILEEDAPPSPGSGRGKGRMRFWSTDSQTSVSNMSQSRIFSLFSSTNTIPAHE